MTSLKRFNQIVYFTDLTKGNIQAYDSWLHGHQYVSTIHSYHKFLKIYINDAIQSEIIGSNPYDGIKIERGKSGLRRYLTPEEVQKIETAEIKMSVL